MADNGHKNYSDELDPGGFSSIQVALIFCSLGFLAAVLLTPLLSAGADRLAIATGANGVDRIVTGGVQPAKADEVRRYTIRQSVLNSDPSTPCIIFEDGTQQGGC